MCAVNPLLRLDLLCCLKNQHRRCDNLDFRRADNGAPLQLLDLLDLDDLSALDEKRADNVMFRMFVRRLVKRATVALRVASMGARHS